MATDKTKNIQSLKKAAVSVLILILVPILCFYAFRSAVKTLYPLRYDEFVETYTKQYGLSKTFVLSVIKCESNFDKNAVSPVGARGLMQIMPETFSWLQSKTKETMSEDMLFDAETNIKYGCYLYKILLAEFGDEKTAAAAYHAGMGNVKKWLSNEEYSSDGKTLINIPFSTTKAYCERIEKTKKFYRMLYNI